MEAQAASVAAQTVVLVEARTGTGPKWEAPVATFLATATTGTLTAAAAAASSLFEPAT